MLPSARAVCGLHSQASKHLQVLPKQVPGNEDAECGNRLLYICLFLGPGRVKTHSLTVLNLCSLHNTASMALTCIPVQLGAREGGRAVCYWNRHLLKPAPRSGCSVNKDWAHECSLSCHVGLQAARLSALNLPLC